MFTRAVQPTRPPARTRPAFTQSDCFDDLQRVPSSKTRRRGFSFESPRSKPVKPDLFEDIKFWRILQWFQRVLSLIWQISATKTIRSCVDTLDQAILGTIWGKNHQIDEILTGSWPNRARSRRFWPFFYVFRQVSASPKTDATHWKTDPRNSTLLTGRLQVENLPTRSLTGRLWVGHKPNPLDPWTPLTCTMIPSEIFFLISFPFIAFFLYT